MRPIWAHFCVKSAHSFCKKMLTWIKMRAIINPVLVKQLQRILAQIAQSVEQGTENPCVAGSIPALGISDGKTEKPV